YCRYFSAVARFPRLRLICQLISWCNEPRTGSLALRLACSPCKTSPVELLPLTLAQLLAERAIYNISSFQNIRSARIILALPKRTKEETNCAEIRCVSYRPFFVFFLPPSKIWLGLGLIWLHAWVKVPFLF